MRLAEHPDVRHQLVEHPELVPQAVEEFLRLEQPAWPSRRAVRDAKIGGVTVKADEMVLVPLSSVNRDPEEFADPENVRLDREVNRHIGFSAGPHRCVGSHLGRIELRVALEEIHRRLPEYRLDPARPPRRYLGHVACARGFGLLYEPLKPR